ncbi:hypothetical protein GGI1_08818, partial [Acidithiobacillus sp. GGI-221]
MRCLVDMHMQGLVFRWRPDRARRRRPASPTVYGAVGRDARGEVEGHVRR